MAKCLVRYFLTCLITASNDTALPIPMVQQNLLLTGPDNISFMIHKATAQAAIPAVESTTPKLQPTEPRHIQVSRRQKALLISDVSFLGPRPVPKSQQRLVQLEAPGANKKPIFVGARGKRVSKGRSFGIFRSSQKIYPR